MGNMFFWLIDLGAYWLFGIGMRYLLLKLLKRDHPRIYRRLFLRESIDPSPSVFFSFHDMVGRRVSLKSQSYFNAWLVA